MQNDAIVISDDEEPTLLRENKSRRVPRKSWVDLISDEERDKPPPKKKPPFTPLADRGKQAANSRVDQQPLRTRSPQTVSYQRSTPSLTQDKQPSRKSKTAHDAPSPTPSLVVSGDAGHKSHAGQSGAVEPGAEGISRGISTQPSFPPGAFRPSSPPRSSLSTDTARGNSADLPHTAFAGTSLLPRLTLRGPSEHSPPSAQSHGPRSIASRSSGAREAEEVRSLETRSTSRRATGTPISLLNTNFGDSKRRISRARLGTSSSVQQHIDGEDSDSDNAARALRDSINAVLGPLSKQSEESEVVEEDIIQRTRGVLRDSLYAATAPQRQRSEEAPSSGNDAEQEAATAQLLKDVFELPAKPSPPQSGLETLLFPSHGNTTNDKLDLKSTTPPREDQKGSRNQRSPSLTMEARKRKILGKNSQGNWSEDDPLFEKTKATLPGVVGSDPPLAKGPAPLEIESLTERLRRHEITMWSDQSYLIKPALRQAKLDCVQAGQPKLDRNLPDPFAGLVGDSFAPAEKLQTDIKNQTRSKLQARVFNSSYTQHNDGLIYFDSIEYESTISALPKYKSIVRLGPNILAKNDRALKYMPYFTSEEDPQSRQKKELLDELQKRYDDRVETLPAQRRCSERAEFWRECVEGFLSEIEVGFHEILYFLLLGPARGTPKHPTALQSHEICPSCKTSCPREDWDELLRYVESDDFPRPEEQKLALAGLACQVVLDVAKFSIWHIALTASSTKRLLWELKQSALDSMKLSTLCLICYLHDCPTHGAYLERAPGSNSASDSSEDSENDGELGHNVRQRVTLSIQAKDTSSDHECGIYCIGSEIESRDILGLHTDGEVTGLVNTGVLEDLPAALEDNQLCSDDCFWAVEKRELASTITTPGLDLSSFPEKLPMYQVLLPTFRNNRRGPCLISLGLGNVSCLAVFQQMRSDASAVQHHTSPSELPVVADGKRSQTFEHEGENSNTHHLDNRIPFIPCSHAGPCDKDSGCSCYSNRTSCERMCGCSKMCGRRYQGCLCGAKYNSVCFKDDRCSCWRLNRECDPWLCGTCGVLEVLDPVNRYNEEIQSSHCKNAKLQRDVPRRTLKGKSDVQGWGLFAGEDMKKYEYIGEYKGEVVGEQESNRRGAVYHHRGLEYLFNLNKGQEIDSSRAGNKMRFINNSCKGNIINVEAKKMFCNGVQRIMLFSKKHIDAGEELFFNYGYPKSVTKNFWERDELPGQGNPEDSGVREEAAGGNLNTGRGAGRPRKKGVGRKISSKKQSRSEGRWVKSIPDELGSQYGVAGDDEEATSFRREESEEAQQSFRRRKRKRKRSENEVDQWSIPADEPEIAEANGDSNHAGGAAFQSAPEIAESEDDDFEDDLASQESSSSTDDEEDVDEDLEDEEDATSDSDVVRRRRISAGDTRYGGKSQRAGWATRRLKAAQAVAATPTSRPKKTRGMRSARGSWLGTGGRPPKRGK